MDQTIVNDEDKADQSVVNENENEEDESVLSTSDVSTKKPRTEPTPADIEGEDEEEKLPFPAVSDLNTRLRRVITNYQRDYKKQQLKKEQQAKVLETKDIHVQHT